MICSSGPVPVWVPVGYDVGIINGDPHQLITRVGGERIVYVSHDLGHTYGQHEDMGLIWISDPEWAFSIVDFGY